MPVEEDKILTNDFIVRYDEAGQVLRIYTIHDGEKSPFPIDLQLDTLKDMGRGDASRWVGETLLLLVPEIRRKLFDLDN